MSSLPPNETLIFGLHPVKHLLFDTQIKVKSLWFYKKADDKTIESLKRRAKQKSINFKEEQDKKVLDQMVDFENHQGVVASVSSLDIYQSIDILKNAKKVLILDHLQDPHNFGAILRSADQFGVDGVIIPKNRSVSLTSTVVKVSSGAALFVPIIREASLLYVVEKLQEFGFWVYSTDVQEGENLKDISFAEKSAIIVGNEGQGVSQQLLKKSDFKMNIPSSPKRQVDSLNVSVATGVILYELFKSHAPKEE